MYVLVSNEVRACEGKDGVDRFVALIKAFVVGCFLAGLVAIFAVTLLGTIFMVRGATVHLAIGPVPFLTEWSGPGGDGYNSEWGIIPLTLIGAAVYAARELRPKPPLLDD